MRRLEDFEARRTMWCLGRSSSRDAWKWGERARDGVDSVKCACENEQVVAVEFVEARREIAVVDETAGLVDDEESEYYPMTCLSVFMNL